MGILGNGLRHLKHTNGFLEVLLNV